MANLVDRVGAFRAKIAEAALGETRNGYPSFNVKFALTQYWCDDPALFAEFEITEPGWVDWSGYDMETLGFFVLCNNDKRLLNYDQVMAATGWDGASFSKLMAMDLTQTEVLVRVEENTWNEQTTLRANWIDHKDAPVERQLKSLDAEGLKGLDAKFKNLMPTAKAAAPVKAPAKPATAPAKAAAPAPKAGPATVPGKPTAAPAAPTSPATKTLGPAKPAATAPVAPSPVKTASPSKPAPSKPAPAPAKEEAPFTDPLAGTTKAEAWEAVSKLQGDVSDDDIAKHWTDAGAAIGPDEDAFTPEQWATLRDAVIAKIS